MGEETNVGVVARAGNGVPVLSPPLEQPTVAATTITPNIAVNIAVGNKTELAFCDGDQTGPVQTDLAQGLTLGGELE